MKKLMKVFLVIFWVLLVGCSKSTYHGSHISGTSYGTSAFEASLANYNFSLSDINEAVVLGFLSADEAALLISVQTPVGVRGQSKSVRLSILKRLYGRLQNSRQSSGSGSFSGSDFNTRRDKLLNMFITAGN